MNQLVLFNYISAISCEEKRDPVQIVFPSQYAHSILLELPENLSVEKVERSYSNAAFSFREDVKVLSGSSFKVNYFYKSKANEIANSDFPKACQDSNDIYRDLPILVSFVSEQQSINIQQPKVKRASKKRRK